MNKFALLAVDDTRDNLFLLEQLVETYLPECELVTAGSAREALEHAAARDFDGALIDVQMPEMDGVEVCRRLKAKAQTRRLSVLLITAKESTPQLRAEGLAAGADDFISRPIDNAELLARIRVMLRLKAAEKREIVERERTESALQRALEHAHRRGTEAAALLESLETNEKRFRSVVETASDAILYIDQAGTIAFCNQASCRTFGYHVEQMVGQPVSMLMPEEYRARHDVAIAHFFQTRQPKLLGRTVELVGRRSDGSNFPIELSIAAWETESACFVTGVIRDITARKQAEEALKRAHQELEDRVRERTAELLTANQQLQTEITERKRAEQALRETNALLERVFATTQMSLAYMDTNMNFLRVNRAYAEKDGHPPEYFVGKNHFQLYPNEENEVIFRRVARTGDPVEFYAKPFSYAANPERGVTYWDWSLHPVKSEAGQVEGLLMCLVDVTQRERAEARGRQHQAELAHVSRLSTMGEMGSAIAHELNQPLCAILSSAQASMRLLRTAGTHDGPIVGAVEQIATQAKRAGDIIRHLREFTRHRAFHRSTVQMAEVVREAAGFVMAEARPHNVKLHLDIPDDLPPVLGDTIQIEQILINLMRNGIEAMESTDEAKRRLDISVRAAEPDMIEVAIRDAGRGLPPGDVDRLFEPFFSTKADGMGIGLAISRSIVEFHGGRLWATPAPEAGAIFHFVLPTGSP